MVGSWRVRVLAARPFTIHSDVYFELHVVRLDEPAPADTGFVLRVPQHAIAAEPLPGQTLEVSFLMGQVTSASLKPSADG
jgi:hypothetical protein